MKSLGCGTIIFIGFLTLILTFALVTELGLGSEPGGGPTAAGMLMPILIPITVMLLLFLVPGYIQEKREREERQQYYAEKERLARNRDCETCGARWHELTEIEHAQLKKEIYHRPDCPWYEKPVKLDEYE